MAIMEVLTKTCSGCNNIKPLTDFYAHSTTKDRRHIRCKQCKSDATKADRARNRARPQHIVDALQKLLVKQCRLCGTNKPLSDFNKAHSNHNGLAFRCKQCSREANKRSRQRNKDRSQDVIAASIPCIKLCSECNTEKTESEFSPSADRKDGLTSSCRECNRLRSADYRARVPERYRESYQAYQAANRTILLLKAKKWQKENPEQCAAKSSKRRARKKSAHGFHTGDDVKKLMLLQRGKCAACKTDIRAKYTVDHITALARGGTDNKDNLQLLCQRCNGQKHAKHPIDFMRERGYLL